MLNKNQILNWCTWQHQWRRPVRNNSPARLIQN